MPDICMCRDEDCPQKGKCYRYMAKPSELQSYVVKTFREYPRTDPNYCGYFWPLRKEK